MPLKNKNVIKLAFQDFRNRVDELERVLPTVLANEAVNETLDIFKEEAFDGKPWQKRKGKADNPLLQKSGALRRSPQVYGYKQRGFTLGSDLPYAAVHNWGLRIQRKARSETFVRNRIKKGINKGRFRKGNTDGQGMSFKQYQYYMPQRQFIGNTLRLRLRLYKAAKEEHKQIMR